MELLRTASLLVYATLLLKIAGNHNQSALRG